MFHDDVPDTSSCPACRHVGEGPILRVQIRRELSLQNHSGEINCFHITSQYNAFSTEESVLLSIPSAVLKLNLWKAPGVGGTYDLPARLSLANWYEHANLGAVVGNRTGHHKI